MKKYVHSTLIYYKCNLKNYFETSIDTMARKQSKIITVTELFLLQGTSPEQPIKYVQIESSLQKKYYSPKKSIYVRLKNFWK